MRLLCNGSNLDLNKNTKVTFTKSNPLFAFDSISCERTAEFELPDTPNNNRVFMLSKNPAFKGEGMRRRFEAQMVDGVCVKNGYLYISSYSGGKYKAIFVTGEMYGLQKIRDLGKLKDIVVSPLSVEYGATPITPTAGLAELWENVKHKRKFGSIRPSIKVDILSDLIVEQNALKNVTIPNVAKGLRIIPATLKNFENEKIRYYSQASPQEYKTSGQCGIVYDNYIEDVRQGSGIEEYFYSSSALTKDFSESISSPRYGYVMYQQAEIGIVITFPEDFPNDVYMVSSVAEGVAVFRGGYSFKVHFGSSEITRYGTPLAGRSVMVESGGTFAFVHEGDMTIGAESDYYGWYFTHELDLVLSVSAAEQEATLHDLVRLQDNLPDITYVELLKAVAALSGKALYYTDKDGITFDEVAVNTWGTIDLTDKVISLDNVGRTFGDYAKANQVHFDSGDYVYVPISSYYTIDNDNIEATRELQKIPFTEGGVDYASTGEFLICLETPEGEDDNYAIADSGSPEFLLRCSLPKNAGIQRLCDSSTKVELKAQMKIHEYEKITPKTKILCQGILYVWTSAKWSNEVAEFTLAKI